ncbi:carbohydrate-binding protein [Actinoplanes regularis]|uniref:carbohydrate-binding protein n=1 Tax=Actinoplanes regularis TaxID=52697 RepID=UPI0024A33EC1|nr:carbohydrate-binding protein [Actinoplanes regularis]GLW29726.1 hypothetical protein Areg01_26660 [Actinoplanes regularis]
MRHGARWLRPLLAAAVTVSVLTGSGVAHADTVTRTVFSDGFGGDRGTGVDTAKWTGDTWDARLDGDGHVALGSWLCTESAFSQPSGRASARIQAGRASARRALGVLTADGGVVSGQVEMLGDDDVDDWDFHTYAIDWTRTSFVWSIDGRQVLRLTPAAAGQPFRLALNLGGGGRRSGGVVVDSVSVAVRYTVVSAPAWKAFTTYKVGDQVTYKGVTYRVLEQHTALPGWQPGPVPALFQKI